MSGDHCNANTKAQSFTSLHSTCSFAKRKTADFGLMSKRISRKAGQADASPAPLTHLGLPGFACSRSSRMSQPLYTCPVTMSAPGAALPWHSSIDGSYMSGTRKLPQNRTNLQHRLLPGPLYQIVSDGICMWSDDSPNMCFRGTPASARAAFVALRATARAAPSSFSSCCIVMVR